MALKRNHQLIEGDILEIDNDNRRALVAAIELNPVFVIDLSEIEKLDKLQIIQTCIELGHAIGNQHWPAVIKGTKVYVPLTVDRKVMKSVMDTHAIPGVTYSFEEGSAVIPYLAPTRYAIYSEAHRRRAMPTCTTTHPASQQTPTDTTEAIPSIPTNTNLHQRNHPCL